MTTRTVGLTGITRSIAAPGTTRLALGISYRGTAYQGWQSQTSGRTVQDRVERALSTFVAAPIQVVCAGRTDAGVHAFNQVIHLDSPVVREPFSWLRGVNRYLPSDIAVQWCRAVPPDFHARYLAQGRRYRYLLLASPVRPALEAGSSGWVFRPMVGESMREAAALLVGEHDFSSFRSSECQARSPVKTLRSITLSQHGDYWRIDFDGSAFLHHMVRNIMGCLVAVGGGRYPPSWMSEVLAARDRAAAAPTFSPDGLYFVGPYYDPKLALPEHTPVMGWLP